MARVSKPALEAGTPVKANTAAKHPQPTASAPRSPAARQAEGGGPQGGGERRDQRDQGGGQDPGPGGTRRRAAEGHVQGAPARPAPARKPPTGAGRKVPNDRFLAEQQALLLVERSRHVRQAESLKDEADALAAEMEPGESEFGEEGGEGGNLSIERELDLVLSAQAKAAVDEIERALVKIENGNYGMCEKCGKEIPRARLKVLPHAPLCVACKSGGLSRR